MNISAGANNCSGLDIIMGRGRKEEYKILKMFSVENADDPGLKTDH